MDAASIINAAFVSLCAEFSCQITPTAWATGEAEDWLQQIARGEAVLSWASSTNTSAGDIIPALAAA